jgi:hypothetical protein
MALFSSRVHRADAVVRDGSQSPTSRSDLPQWFVAVRS